MSLASQKTIGKLRRFGTEEMAMKCPWCSAENPLGTQKCRTCGRTIFFADSEVSAPANRGWSEGERASTPTIAPENRRKIVAVVLALVIVLPVALFLAYYYQPVRGVGSSSLTTVCVNNSVEFNFNPSQGVGPYRYSWSFGDGSTSSDKNPTHTYAHTGTYRALVTVTDRAGMKCAWTTTITVRTPLVFIDKVSYPSWVAYYPLGDTYCKLFVDGHQVVLQTASLQPGTNHSIELQIIGVLDLNSWGVPGGGRQETTLLDEKGTVTAPTTETDLRCALQYDPLHYAPAGRPTFTLVAL